jgi:hypothetical protein
MGIGGFTGSAAKWITLGVALLDMDHRVRADESSAAIRDFVEIIGPGFPAWRQSCNREELRKFVGACEKYLKLAEDLTARPAPDMALDIQQARATLEKLDRDGSSPPSTKLCQEDVEAAACLARLRASVLLLDAKIRATLPKQTSAPRHR